MVDDVWNHAGVDGMNDEDHADFYPKYLSGVRWR
jgi:hypothetical protein